MQTGLFYAIMSQHHMPGRKPQEANAHDSEQGGLQISTARSSDAATSLSWPRGLTTFQRGRVHCHPRGSESGRRQWTGPGQQRLSLGSWNVTKLAGKELEMVQEVEQYQLDLVGLHPHKASVLEANSWVGVGLYPSPELPKV